MDRLITHEDPFHLHKTMGVFCLMNYAVQYNLFFRYGTHNIILCNLIPHILLHVTSFAFTVLKRRPAASHLNMFIWNELRIHSMLFAYRSIFSILFPKLAVVIGLATLVLADITSNYYGTPGVSTVRGQQERVGKRPLLKEISGAFFSISQFGATIISMGLLQPSVSPILVFSTLPPIQTSAFGMTLIRKNIINKTVWSVVYAVELGITYAIWYQIYGNFDIFIISAVLYFLRRVGISKYLIWMTVIQMHFLLIQIRHQLINK